MDCLKEYLPLEIVLMIRKILYKDQRSTLEKVWKPVYCLHDSSRERIALSRYLSMYPADPIRLADLLYFNDLCHCSSSYVYWVDRAMYGVFPESSKQPCLRICLRCSEVTVQ